MTLPVQLAAQLVQDLAPKFTMGSKWRVLIVVALISVPLICYFSWLYYHEWKTKRDFQRYWEGKSRKH
ncbi:MAG TPA: hypothetical protein VL793_06160 [Patescibacteria group bacterium]|jgi:hypothetical protein|nr:hypothetical protein [Patescibacteria group bacterium]